jgi:large subunit ribosomal protein L27
MAHTKAQGSVKGNRDSRSKRRGVKLYGGQKAESGNIIVRQKGSKFNPGVGVSMGRDFTLFAIQEGIVTFKKLRGKKYVEVIHG